MKRVLPILLAMIFATTSCQDVATVKKNLEEIETLRLQNDSLKSIIENNNATRNNQIITFLTFQDNNAENAMKFYVALFDNSKIVDIKRWEKGGPVEEGKIMHATFDLNGKLFMCSDSPPIHDWDFSPAVSNYLECESVDELEKLFSKLSEKGKVTMPVGNYGFSQQFGWVIDQFGISWQLNVQ